jgi:predicted DNA-binding transcriptional regulator YafY
MDDPRTDLPGLHEAEIASLFLAAPDKALGDLGWRRASEGAIIKLLAALPGVGRRTAEFVRERIYLDSNGWKESEEKVDALPALLEAILQENKVLIAYEKGGDAPAERLVAPLGLVMKGTVWYLIGSVDDGEPRTYRISRIVRCEPTEERAVRPANFRLSDYWEASTERFVARLPRFEATLRVDPEYEYFVRMWKYATVLERKSEDAEGWIECRVRFQTEEEACRLALALGAHGELTEPPGLRGRVARMAAETAEWYARRSNADEGRESGGGGGAIGVSPRRLVGADAEASR